MQKIKYDDARLRPVTLKRIAQANEIVDEYMEQGYKLTLRQLYYQFVARDMIPNTMDSYRRLGKAVVQGRMAGIIDWTSIEDRTRNLVSNTHWESPDGIMRDVIGWYMLDRWQGQRCMVEVLVEKDALLGVIGVPCRELDVPYMACRGYMSQSTMWRLAQRILSRDVPTIILHFGDHDPSGIDMTRSIVNELNRFGCGSRKSVKRVALNMAQVKKYKPPPAPVKPTDSRTKGYIERFETSECWELDALEPNVLVNLIKKNVLRYRDEKTYTRQLAKERKHVQTLRELRGASL